MIDFTTVRQTIESHLATNYTTTPIKFENVGLREDSPSFIALSDKATFADNLGMGEAAQQTGGLLLISIFTPIGGGTQHAREIATELAGMLANQQVEDVSFGEAELHTVGEVEGYYQHGLQIPYQFIFGGTESQC